MCFIARTGEKEIYVWIFINKSYYHYLIKYLYIKTLKSLFLSLLLFLNLPIYAKQYAYNQHLIRNATQHNQYAFELPHIICLGDTQHRTLIHFKSG